MFRSGPISASALTARRRMVAVTAIVVSVGLHGALAAAMVFRWGESDGPRYRDVYLTMQSAPVMRYEADKKPATKASASRPNPSPISLGPGVRSAEETIADILASERAAASEPVDGAERGSTIRPAAAGEPGIESNLVTFAGVSADAARARSVVFVVDASGPMVSSLPIVLRELRRSVRDLQPTQRFNVILFGQRSDAESGVRSFSPKPVDATPIQLEQLDRWLAKAEAGGRSTPLAGLREALMQRPAAVFLLCKPIPRTGGGQWDLGAEATLAELQRLNPADASGARRTIIKIVQFLDADPSGMLERIASDHGSGSLASDLKIVSRKELPSQ